MKQLKQLTREQAIEIAKLVYGYPEYIKSDFDFLYQPFDETWFADAREYVRVLFDAPVFADKIEKIMLEIDVKLNCYIYYCRPNGAQELPTRNQYLVQKKFMEWEFEPKEYEK